MKIRKLRLDDIPIIMEMAKKEEGFKVGDAGPYFWSREQLENWVNTDEDVLLVAEINGTIAGFVLGVLHKPTGKFYWENQMVAPKFRNRGVARALVDEMKLLLKAKDATYIHFLVRTDNKNIEFYKNCGFEVGYDFTWFGMHL